MDLDLAIQYALDGDAILFAGSGFSYGAINALNKPFKTGLQLRDYLASECGIDDTDESLETVSLLYKKMYSSRKLVDTLKEQFSLKKIKPYHQDLLTIPWKRIYTTNYDRVIEEASIKNNRALTPIILSDRLNGYDKKDICIHLNGYIERLNVDNLENSFKLTDRSYSCDTLKGEPWFDFFKADIKSANVIIIIGFSMKSDIDIKRLLSPPEIKKKVVFITKENLEQLSTLLLEEYGTCYQLGIEKFRDIIIEKKAGFIPKPDMDNYTSFIYERMSTFLPEKVDLDDLVDLFYLGKVKDKLFKKEPTREYSYVVFREEINRVIKCLGIKKVFLVTSDLGNGKTLFCNLLRNELREKDVNVFTLHKNLVDIDIEIEKISAIRNKHSVVIIENYYSHYDILRRFHEMGIKNITFVLTARRAISRLSYRIIYNILEIDEEQLCPIYIDSLNGCEIEQLAYIIKNNSLLSVKFSTLEIRDIKDYLINRCKSKFSNILLDLFNSSDIKQRLIDLYSDHNNAKIKNLTNFALIKSTMNIEIDFFDMCDLLSFDSIKIRRDENEYLNEIFDFANDDIMVKSSIVAKALLDTVVDLPDLINLMVKIVEAASKSYKINTTYNELLKNIVSHTHFVPYLAKGNNDELVKAYYNRIRNTEFCKNNPFFWEQFASACIDTKDFTIANQCINNAFAEAKKIPGFVPFQIETIKAKCIIEELIFDLNRKHIDANEIIDRVLKCHEHLLKYYKHPENNLYYVFKIGYKYTILSDKYTDHLNNRQKSILIEKMVELARLMKGYLNESKDDMKVSGWENGLEAALKKLKK